MKRLNYLFAAFAIIAFSAFSVIKSQDWKIGEDYSIKFTSKDPSGVFRGLKGNISFDEKTSQHLSFLIWATIDVASINTGNGMKNTHAKSEKWFDAEKYPVIKFTSSEITSTATGYQAKGTLEIHGVKKDIVLPFTFQKNDTGGVFTSSFDINRLDYNINTAEPAHGASVVTVDISVPVTK